MEQVYLDDILMQHLSVPVVQGFSDRFRSEGGLSMSLNLSTRLYPHLTGRMPRGIVPVEREIYAMTDQEGLCYLDSQGICFKGHHIPLSGDLANTRLMPFGRDILLLPRYAGQGIYGIFRTDRGEMESMDYTRHFTGELEVQWAWEDGTVIENVAAGNTPPEDGSQYWVLTSLPDATLMEWHEDSRCWEEVHACLALHMKDIGTHFSPGACVQLDIRDQDWLCSPNKVFRIVDVQKDSILIRATMKLAKVIQDMTQVRITTVMPKMDLYLEHNNRLWGCRYGRDVAGNFVNEIYASALGDPTVWYRYDGLSYDSYTMSVGVSGPFTGCAVVGGCPVFFKENCLIRITGNRPSNFQAHTLNCSGVRVNCEDTIAYCDRGIYYLGRDGLCLYDGSMPMVETEKVDLKHITHAVAGMYGKYYYLSNNDDPVNTLLVYDTERWIWNSESSDPVREFCSVSGELYFTTQTGGLYCVRVLEGMVEEAPFWWKLETHMPGTLRRRGMAVQGISILLEDGHQGYFRMEQGSEYDGTFVIGESFDEVHVPKMIFMRETEGAKGDILRITGQGVPVVIALEIHAVPEKNK